MGGEQKYEHLDEDRQVMNAAVRAAGEAILRRFRGNNKTWAKDDDSPVSIADHEANEILHWHLMVQHKRHYGFLSEESADAFDRLQSKRTWIIDPIDGTRAFLKGDPHFTVCAALVEDGKALAAAVFNPATEEFFEAETGKGALLNGAPAQASGADRLENCNILGWPGMFKHPGWPIPWPVMNISQRNSTNYRMALVASGEVDAMLAIARKADWDAAPGALIAEEAGATVTDHTGAKFCYNQPEPYQRSVVCAAPGLYSSLFARVSHLPASFTAGSSQKEKE